MFVHLRLHTAFSLSEGAIRIPQAADLCLQHNMPALAVTDTNNLFGALEFSTHLSSKGIQPIIGCTLNIDLTAEVEHSQGAKRFRQNETVAKPIVLLATSREGYLNLSRLSSIAFLDSVLSDSPCLTLDQIETHNEGLIALTGGRDGAVDYLLQSQFHEPAQKLIGDLHRIFGDRLYIELQRHLDGKSDITEPDLLRAADSRGIPVVATNEPYFSTPDMHEAHDALLCIADGTYLIQSERRHVTREHYFKSPEEMTELFADIPQAVSNSLEIAKRCAFMPEVRDPILPTFKAGADESDELREQAIAGLKKRFQENELFAPEEQYWQRLDYELDIIIRMKFPGYFLIVADFIQWSKTNDIPVGPGRGSGAGSLIAWALTITDLDPLRFNLLFERFLNPERISMPDFDIDFCQDRRDDVITYVQDKYGEDKVAQIITFGKLQARAVVRDVGRVMGLPYGQVDRICKLIPNNPADPTTLSEALDTVPELRTETAADENVDRLVNVALKLEGLYRHASTHAAGVVIGDRQLEQLLPLYRDPKSTMPVTQFNLNWVEPAGLVKFDFLGLKTLTVLKRACELLQKDGIALDINHIPLDDTATYEMLSKGDSIGVFQFESAGMRDLMRQAQPTMFEDLIALVALYRPGPMENIPKYLACKHGEEEPEYLHEMVSAIVEETYGVIIYQEQVMQIAQTLSGYSLGEADLLRRAMGKKKKEEMDRQKDRFVEGAVAKGVDKDRADYIFDLVAKFAGYGFNKSHSACYAYIAYQTAYLKANYPVHFYAASMSLDMLNTDKLYIFYADAQRHGIPVAPPDINNSNADFSTQDNAVVYALAALKNVGKTAMEHVVSERKKDGVFQTVFDFAQRIEPGMVNKKQIEQLAKAGAFDSLSGNRAQVHECADQLMMYAQQAAHDRSSTQVNLFGEDVQRQMLPDLKTVLDWSSEDRLDREKEAIGFYLSGHPLDRFTDYLEEKKVSRIADLRTQEDFSTRTVVLAGTIHTVRERRSRTSDKPYAHIALSDSSGDFEVTVFSDVLVPERAKFAVSACVLLICVADWENENLRLTVKSIRSLEAANEAVGKGLKVYIHDPAAVQSVRKVLDHSDQLLKAKAESEAAKSNENGKDTARTIENGNTNNTGQIRLVLQTPVNLPSTTAAIIGAPRSETAQCTAGTAASASQQESDQNDQKERVLYEMELVLPKPYPVSYSVKNALKSTPGVIDVVLT